MSEVVGEAVVNVTADTGSVKPEVKKTVEEAERLGPIKIKTEVDKKSARDALGTFGTLQFSLAKTALKVGALGATFTNYGALLKGAAAATVAVGGAVVNAGASAASVAPIYASLGAAFATVKIGLVGVPDAIKATSAAQDELATTGSVSAATMTKQAQAMGKLAPQARDFVDALAAGQPKIDRFRQSVQGQLFAGLDDSVTQLIGMLPHLQSEFDALAGTISQTAQSTVDWVSSSETSQQIQRILRGLNDILARLAPSIQAFGAGLLDIFEGLLPSGARLADSITRIGQQFQTWARGVRASGDLQRFMSQAQDAASSLIGIIGNLGDALFTTLEAGSAQGGELLASLDDLTGRLADFLHTAEGKAALDSFFDGIGEGSKALQDSMTVLKPILQGLFDALQALGPALTSVREAMLPIWQVVGSQLGPAIAQLAQGLAPVIQAFADLVSALPPSLVGTLVSAALAMKLFNTYGGPVGKTLTSISGSIRTFGTDMSAVGRTMTTTGGGFKSIASQAGSAIKNIAGLGAAAKAAAGGAGMLALSDASDRTAGNVKTLESTMGGAAVGFSVAGPWGAAVGGAIGLLSSFNDEAQDTQKAVDTWTASLDANTGAVTRQSAAMATNEAKRLAGDLDTLNISQETYTQALLGNKSAQQQVSNAIQQAEGDSHKLILAHGATSDALTKEGEAAKSVKGSFDGMIGSQKQAASSAKAANKAWQQSKHDSDAASSAIDRQTASIDALIDAQNELADKHLSGRDAALKFRQTLLDATKAGNENKNALDKGKQATVTANQALDDLARAWNDQTSKVQNTKGNYEKMRQAFINTATDMGFTKQKAQDLAHQLLDMPHKVDVKIVTNALTIQQQMEDLGFAIKNIPDKEIHISTVVTGVRPGTGRTFTSGSQAPGVRTGLVATSPTLAVFGEAGPELVVPMRPNAPMKPSVEAALVRLAEQRTGRAPGVTPTINVYPPTGDPEAIGLQVLNRLAVVGIVG